MTFNKIVFNYYIVISKIIIKMLTIYYTLLYFLFIKQYYVDLNLLNAEQIENVSYKIKVLFTKDFRITIIK